MNKIIFLLTLIIFNSFITLNAEIINKITVNNNERISLNTVITYGNIDIGKNYSKDDLNQILKNLYNTNFFSNISITIDNGIMIIDVVENQIIQSISINGIKSKSIQKAILDNLILKSKSPFIKSVIEEDLIRIKKSLSEEGYYFSTVTSTINKNANNSVDLFFNIDLGNKSKISNIEFTGNKIFKDRTLRNLITVEEAKFWKFLSGKKFLNQQSLALDERLLRQFFLNNGYYDVIVNTSTATLLNNDSFKLTYNIDAGNLYKINNTNLELPVDYDPANFTKVQVLLAKLENNEYSFSKISKIVKEIDKISLSREYDFINAAISEEKVGENKLNITFKVTESEKLYVEKINILGNNITEENVIRSSLEVDEGDPFNELLHSKSLNNIKSLNIFKSVKSETLEGSSPTSKIININVIEKPTGEISLGAGIGSDGGTVGFSVSENNFLGKGVKLSTALRLSGDTVRGNFTVNNPNFNYTGRSLSTNIESSKTDKLEDSGYETVKTGFSLGTRYEAKQNLFFQPAISTFFETIDTNSTASAALRKQDGSYFENKFTYNLDYDLRDKRFQTTEGTRSIFTQAIPLISEEFALLNGYEIKKWHKFNNKMIANVSFYGRTINSLNGEDVRVSDRLALPANKLKGFKRGKIGPRDNLDYVGGNHAAAINLSTTLPMFLQSLEKIDLRYFLDAGNLWGVDYSSTVDESNSLRSSTGVTVDWFTPIGPLNFTFTHNLLKASTDETEAFQFNLGTTFWSWRIF